MGIQTKIVAEVTGNAMVRKTLVERMKKRLEVTAVFPESDKTTVELLATRANIDGLQQMIQIGAFDFTHVYQLECGLECEEMFPNTGYWNGETK